MDAITQKVQSMYKQYPYPSKETGIRRLVELYNLLQLFAQETDFDYKKKMVLDAGTGTGHRLVEAARHLPETAFTAIDMSEASLGVAKKLAAENRLANVQFHQRDILGDLSDLGSFELILCMGVLHHLSNPPAGLVNLASRLREGGMVFLYLYGALGGRERMRRKEIVTTLMERRDDFEQGLRLIKELQFEHLEYGWNLSLTEGPVKDGLLVDAYLNVNEALYTDEEIARLMKGAGFKSYAIYGISSAKAGYLFDCALNATDSLGIPKTEPAKFLPTPLARACYERLPLTQKIRLVEAFYQPNGYTVVGFKGDYRAVLPAECRLARNIVQC